MFYQVFNFLLRIFLLFSAFFLYYLQLFCILLNLKCLARFFLVKASVLCLKGLGISIIVSQNHILNAYFNRKLIYIANHGNPLDVLLIQGFWKIKTLTTAHLHLSLILPFIKKSLINYGHIPFDYKDPKSRLNAFYEARRSIRSSNRFFIYPSGSLTTPISIRFSSSVSTLAIDTESVVIPCKVSYSNNLSSISKYNYRPFKLLLYLLFSKGSHIYVNYFDPVDSRQFKSSNTLNDYLKKLYI